MTPILCYDPSRRLIYKTFEFGNVLFLPGTPVYNFYLIDALKQSKTTFSSEELKVIDLLARGMARSIIMLEPLTRRLLGFIVYRKTGRKLRHFMPFVPWKKGWRTIQLLGVFFWTSEDVSMIHKALSFLVHSMAPCFVWIFAKPGLLLQTFQEFGFQTLDISDDAVMLIYRQPSIED